MSEPSWAKRTVLWQPPCHQQQFFRKLPHPCTPSPPRRK